jgi:imidazolonepropionase-like amidohydrolase
MTIKIHADLLIPGRGAPIEDGAAVIDGAKIVFSGAASSAPAADETVRVPVAMPGLWECHGHFTGMAAPDLEKELVEPEAARAARAVPDITATLMGGVTSVREVGGLGIHLRSVVDDGTIPGPHIYPSGGILSTTGGHADVHGFPLEWVTSRRGIGLICDGVPDVLKAVRTNLRAGAAVIKLCASGGVMSEVDHPIHQQFSDEELRAIVEEANRAERAVAAHCHGKPGIMAALRAGVTTIEHGSYLDEEAAEAMVDAGAILVPTRFIVAMLLDHMVDTLPAYAYRKAVMVSEFHEQALKTAVATGVKIAMGTDIFTSGPLYGTNGKEIALLIEAGMAPLDALEAATANGPDTLGGQAPASGQLHEGYDADVIALDFNPLDEWAPWGDPDRVTHVWKSGILVKG